jgi:hypothetical protein
LFNKGEKMNIQILKLINNEEVMAEVETDDTHHILTNPVGVAIVRGSDGRPNVGFAPWPLHAEQEAKDTTFPIAKKHVLYYYTPAEDFINNYKQIFGAGIMVPPTKQIITG